MTFIFFFVSERNTMKIRHFSRYLNELENAAEKEV